MDLEKMAPAVITVVLGVLLAGYIMATLGSSVSIIGTAESGFNGGN